MQRSGVAVNVTLEEYRNAKKRQGCKVITVKKHKMAQQVAAKLVVDGIDLSRLDRYVEALRPMMDPFES